MSMSPHIPPGLWVVTESHEGFSKGVGGGLFGIWQVHIFRFHKYQFKDKVHAQWTFLGYSSKIYNFQASKKIQT